MGNETEIVEGDLEEIAACDAVLAAFTAPDEGTAMEAWHAHALGKTVVAYTGGTPPHPWTVYVAAEVHRRSKMRSKRSSASPPTTTKVLLPSSARSGRCAVTRGRARRTRCSYRP